MSRPAGAGVGAALRWGIAGCGWVARDHALPGLLAAGQQVVALHDRSPAAMERMPVAAARHTELSGLLATPRLDAVYVATPNAAHLEVVQACAAAGVAVLCEKPLGAGIPDAEAIVAACEQARVVLGVAYDQRWHPAHRALRELVPGLGTITAVRIVYCCWLPPDWTPDGVPTPNWRADPVVAGGGAAIDLAPHGLDLVGVLLDDDVVVLSARLQRRVHDYPVDDGALLSGVTAGGVLVDLHVAYNTPDALPRRRLEVVGTGGMVTAVDTMGQTAGGNLVHQRLDGTVVDVPFSTESPFEAQFRAFAERVGAPAGRPSWTFAPERDLRLHSLLLQALEEGAAR